MATVYQGRLLVYRVDIDRDLPVARRFKVKSIPTFLLVRGKGISRPDGYITEADLRMTSTKPCGWPVEAGKHLID